MANGLLLGWIAYMCDCVDVLQRSSRHKQHQDLAAAWLRPIVETFILVAWIEHDEDRANRAIVSQYQQWENQDRKAKGTVFETGTQLPDRPKGPGLPNTSEMAKDVDGAVAVIFGLESEFLHPAATTALSYVKHLETEEVWAIRTARPSSRPARLTGVYGVALYCLLRTALIFSDRFGLGLNADLEAIGSSVDVGLSATRGPDELWEAMWGDSERSSGESSGA